MFPYLYLNGNILPREEASLSVNDLGVLRGYGIFDYLRTYNLKPFLLDRYIDRFYNSAAEMYLPVPVSREETARAVNSLLEKNKISSDAGIRFILTGGPSPDAFSIGTPTFYILVENLPSYPATLFSEGAALITMEYLRLFPHIKTTNYIAAVHARHLCKEKGAIDVLFTYKDQVLEATRNNIFLFLGDTLVTPKDKVLIGRTRNFILSLAGSLFQTEERDVKVEELNKATEIFISGTTRRITPVVRIDGKVAGSGTVGKNTRRLMELFDAHVKQL